MIDVIVIGGGPAGLIGSFYASKSGARTILIEKNNHPGKKLLITGKGRCNITNDCPVEDFIKNTKTNSKFMYSGFYSFTKDDIIEILNNNGVRTKTERGNRVFPVSDRAVDVQSALIRNAKNAGVKIIKDEIISVNKSSEGWLVSSNNKTYTANSVIIATGGLSYPKTGSTGDGYRFARNLDHKVTELKPSLIPINIKEGICEEMMGLSLKNITLCLYDKKAEKNIFKEHGEMVFTHFGISGPLALSMSAHIDINRFSDYEIFIDWKPALDEITLDNRLQRDFIKYANKDFKNSLEDLLPKKSIDIFIRLSGIKVDKKVNQITKEERHKLLALLKNMKLTSTGFRDISFAIITSGGVDVDEINSSTMESKIHKNLFFAGEVIDVDGYTGGFNLQIAYSTGYLAGINSYLK